MISVTKIEKAIENVRVVFSFSNSRSLIGLFISIILEIEFKNLTYKQDAVPSRLLINKLDWIRILRIVWWN